MTPFLIGVGTDVVPAYSGLSRHLLHRWLGATLSVIWDIKEGVPTAKMKHYEVGGVYETLNREWCTLWWQNLIKQAIRNLPVISIRVNPREQSNVEL